MLKGGLNDNDNKKDNTWCRDLFIVAFGFLFIAIVSAKNILVRVGGLAEFECPVTLCKKTGSCYFCYWWCTVDCLHESYPFPADDHGDWTIHSSRIMYFCPRFLTTIRRIAWGSQFCKFYMHLPTFCKHTPRHRISIRLQCRNSSHGATGRTWIKATDIIEKVDSLNKSSR